MPRVKFDYIVSFSSEDPEHPASNLLSWEVSKKKWLCAAGETSASVVLQLEKAVQIGTVAVGAHHAALVEVLVGRSETPADPFQVLVASSVFLSPSESRKAEGAAADRVRSFSAAGGVWAQRWDRLRLSLSQPYNKHCKFGVSFVHVFTPDGVPEPCRPAQSQLPQLSQLSQLSEDDDDEFKPGELFAQHKLQADTDTTQDTGSRIRRATSHVLRTSADTDRVARLVRTSRTRVALASDDISLSTEGGRRKRRRDEPTDLGGGTSRGAGDEPRGMSKDKTEENREAKKEKRGVLAGVVCVLSGYEGARRGAVRAAALALGARVLPAWRAGCTHLVCAFPNTPKLRAVRAAERAGGARVPAVTAQWVDECARRRRRLPEEWYSTEPERRVSPPPSPPGEEGDDDSEDTDDEIERVLRRRRETRDASPPSARDRDGSRDSDDVTSLADHRMQGSVSEGEGEETDVEAEGDGVGEEVGVEAGRGRGRALPPLLRDMVFVSGAPGPLAFVDRYVRAYGGTLIPPEQAERVEGGGTVYALCEAGAGAGAGAGGGRVRRLRLRWLWRAHHEHRLPPLDAYSFDS